MTTNLRGSGRGFSIGYKKGCDVTLKQSHGTITSPGNVAVPYPHSVKCTYTLELPDKAPDQSMSMIFHRFDMGSHDYLKVYEGSIKGRALHEKEGFDMDQPPQTIASRHPKAQLVFHSNSVRNGLGFNMTFSADCSPLKTPPLVSLSSGNTAFGSKVSVFCPAGYEFVNGRGTRFEVVCQAGGTWSQTKIPSCQPVYCSVVPQIANGYAISATNVSYGGVATYSCHDGFSFPSNNKVEEVYCTEKGHWTPAPQCKAATCPALPPFVNGERRLEFGDGVGYGTVYHFECRPGYKIEGIKTVFCQTDGLWSFDQPRCKKLTCSDVGKVANGKILLPDVFQFGDVAKVMCDEGFRVHGPDEIKCLANQKTSSLPVCKDIDECEEGLSQCQTSSTQCVNLPGGYACQCIDGYQSQLVCSNAQSLVMSSVSSSSDMISLHSTRGWCALPLDPLKAITVHFPVRQIVEKIRFNETDEGKVLSVRIRYNSEEGQPLQQLAVDGQDVFDLTSKLYMEDGYLVLPYSIEASVVEISMVKYEGEPCFKADVHGCQKVSCVDINECMRNNGGCEHICINNQGSYKCACREGFDLFIEDGQSGIHLEEHENGTDPKDIYRFNQTCLAKTCPRVESPANGLLLSTLEVFKYPIVVQFQCNFGYQMMGPDYIQCLADGSWNGTTPFCLEATCQGVDNDTAIGMMVNTNNDTIAFGQSVTVTCTQRNRPAPRSPMATTRECIYDPQPDGRDYWLSGPSLDCPLVHCPSLPVLAGVEYMGDPSNTQVGSSVEFTCRQPYMLSGSSAQGDSTVRCTIDGMWELGDLRCEGPVCVDPGYPIDGSIDLQSVEEGSVAKFSCSKPGFAPFPSDSIHCVLGAACVLSEDVGISSGFIPDGAFADNSDVSNYGYEPHRARMSSTGWCGSKDAFIFLSVDLQRTYTLTTLRIAGVAGSGYLKGHVTKMQLFYKTQFSQNYDTYPVEFETPSGNHNAMHQFELNPPLRARYILFGVAEYENNPCIRFDVQGCLAPMTVAHEVPSHLQVGWNASVPQCVDSEPPRFTNCPTDEIFVATDENGQLKTVDYEIPKAVDNSGRVAYMRVEPEGFVPGRPISSDTQVTYTAFDDAGNTAECVIRLSLPDTIPPVLKCPDSYALAARGPEMEVHFNESTVQMVIQDVSNITEVTFEPSKAMLKIGESVEVLVTATDSHSNRNQCRFQVAYMHEPCSKNSLITSDDVIKTCAQKDDSLVCSVSCKKGYRFVDTDNLITNFVCQDGKWSPSGVAPTCIAIVEEPARYELNVAIEYPTSSEVSDHCLQGYSGLVSRSYDGLDQVLSQRCSSSVQVFVRFLQASFSNQQSKVVGNYTIQILPSVLQDVFYDLCGLTLRTIFDLRIPGATTPIRGLLSLAGESIPSQGIGCPTLTAAKSTISQGFGCNEGEVLRQPKKDQLPECLPCPMGTVNVNNTCVACPLGSYQDQQGQTACKACPDGTYTQFMASHRKEDCLGICGNGMFSETGLVPCQLCPRHTFSGPPILGGFRKCVSCPSGTYTAKLGSSGPSQCKQPCQPGSFSITGLEPCSPCPFNYYQSALGQQRCLQCSNETTTIAEGSASEESCITVKCNQQKCKNRSECVVRSHQAICECRPGFTGPHCEQQEDVCILKPCANGGYCEAAGSSYRCVCPQNFSGTRCQFGPDECSKVTCPNGGVCHDLPGAKTTKCLCRTGFAGEDCSEIRDICSSANPCKNGANCIPSQLGRFKCQCLPGWEGETCEINTDDCSPNPCALNATCVDLINDFECQCPKGFHGKRCQLKEDLCVSNPCKHGLCVDTLFEQKCICHSGWTGDRCDENINMCKDDPCENGGKCTPQIDGFKCDCGAGYYGKKCQHLVDHCSTSPCSNNGTCTNLGPSYVCTCPLGYDGVHCEHNVDECKYNRCYAIGTQNCEDGINSFHCVCKPGYSGDFCEKRMDMCSPSPCMNNGSCVDMDGSVQCTCVSGWTGLRCEKESNICSSNPCHNNGHCVPMPSDYFCVCPEGVSGKNCEIAPNRCLGDPCLNGGVCGDFGSKLQCTCSNSFQGEGCQYVKELCSPGSCQNGGSCQVEGNSFSCLCPAGFTGEECETNIDDCQASPCPLGSVCIDQIDDVFCKCPFNRTGVLCDKSIDEEYDLHFSDSVRPSFASLAIPFPVHSHELSISLWLKFDRPMTTGTVMTLFNSSHSNYSSDLKPLLKIDSEGVDVRLFPHKPHLQLHFPSSQKINDGRWNHLIFTWSSEEGSYSLIWNAVRIFEDIGYGTSEELDLNAIITLGASEDAFEGSVTKVHVWNRVLDFENEVPVMATSNRDNEVNFNGLLVRFDGYTRMEGKVEKLFRNVIRSSKESNVDSILTVENCPHDQYMTTNKREVNVTWMEPLFFSQNTVVRVERNLKPGQMFTWGTYDVLYVAFDNSSNTAQCSFKIHISKEHCTPLEDPMNGVQACESWGPQLRHKACSIECRDGFEFSRAPSLFYTCSSDGEWRPREFNQNVFRYPQCTKSIPATRVVVVRLAYPASSLCSDTSKETLRQKLLEGVNQINARWNICSITDDNGCVGSRVDVDCVSEVRRAKREVHAFNIRLELPVKRQLIVDSVSGQKLQVADALQEAILSQGMFNLEKVIPNGRPDLSSFQLSEQYHCQTGQVAVKDVCVPCAPGSFYSTATSDCQLCPEATYQPLAGRQQCFPCPAGQITPGVGSVNEDACKANCPPGHFLDMSTSKCTPCGLGFYQPKGASFKCLSCGIGKITLTTTSVSEDECKDECPDGEQLSSSGTCQPCPVGFYRSKGENKQCQQCPAGTTTEGTSSVRREECNTPRCKAGQFLVKETKHCQFCPRGAFQDTEQQTVCKLCPEDHTTAAQGATAESQCYSTNQCTTGEDNCSWYALCVDLPDDNDVPSFECRCKPGYRGNGTHCTDACNNFCLNDGVCKKNPVGFVQCVCKDNFSGERCEVRFQPRSQRFTLIMAGIGGVVAVLVAIVSIVYMISCRFNRLDDVEPEKSQMDEMGSNFFYGRPVIEPPRPVGYYYEDEDEYEAKTMYVSGEAEENNNNAMEQRLRAVQQHIYRPTTDSN